MNHKVYWKDSTEHRNTLPRVVPLQRGRKMVSMGNVEPFNISRATICFISSMHHKDWLKVTPCQKKNLWSTAFRFAFTLLPSESAPQTGTVAQAPDSSFMDPCHLCLRTHPGALRGPSLRGPLLKWVFETGILFRWNSILLFLESYWMQSVKSWTHKDPTRHNSCPQGVCNLQDSQIYECTRAAWESSRQKDHIIYSTK